jgi:hypothetical protein
MSSYKEFKNDASSAMIAIGLASVLILTYYVGFLLLLLCLIPLSFLVARIIKGRSLTYVEKDNIKVGVIFVLVMLVSGFTSYWFVYQMLTN